MSNLETGINLTGMMNCGKTTVGKIIAEQHNLPFIDTDDLITEVYGQTPGDIIQAEGLEEFMTIQREVILGHERPSLRSW